MGRRSRPETSFLGFGVCLVASILQTVSAEAPELLAPITLCASWQLCGFFVFTERGLGVPPVPAAIATSARGWWPESSVGFVYLSTLEYETA